MCALTRLQEQKLKHAPEEQRETRLGAAHAALRRARHGRYAVLAGEGPDIADQASAEELAAFENALVQRHAEAIRDIDAALSRINEHRVGHCIDCGEDIDFARLSAFPQGDALYPLPGAPRQGVCTGGAADAPDWTHWPIAWA